VAHSTATSRPKKPREDFPLFPGACGRWRKKVRGKVHYFGKVADDPKGERAVLLWLDQKDALLAGRKPRKESDGVSIRHICNDFLTKKEVQRDAGRITNRTLLDYIGAAKVLVDAFDGERPLDDLAADDFDQLYAQFVAKKYNPNTITNLVGRVRSICKFAFDQGHIAKPLKFGTSFRPAPQWQLDKLRDDNALEHGDRAFQRDDLLATIAAADQPLKAMILLGVNAGFGNNDCGRLPLRALDLDAGWVRFPRPKTGVRRRCKLWPETVDALREAITLRPKHKDPVDAGLVFITKYGHAWAKKTQDGPISKEMTKLLKRIELHRPGLGFYSLRRTFETIGGDACDQVAVDFIMGHKDGGMAQKYRERIEDKRLIAVTTHVHKWLFPKRKAK
jgi:integrase